MNIGYACLTIGVANTQQKSCMLRNASEARLMELISHNLNSLENIIDYNIANGIKLFRISSDIIPFGSSPTNSLIWWEMFSEKFLSIGRKIQASGMRVSMHPGQYTVLNSPNEEIVNRVVEDLNYHTQVLDSLGLGSEHKIVLHIGGIYNDKKLAIERFISNYDCLDEAVKRRLVIENDDKCYNIFDVLEISKHINTPVIFDNLHNEINSFDKEKGDYDWINECSKTWRAKDGHQKIHYAQQDPLKKGGSHSNSIRIDEFMQFYENLENKKLDIMLEVKDKNLSAVKCINCTASDKSIKALELEWSRYKYKVLENSHSDYIAIRKLLTNKKEYPAIEFYRLVDNAIKKEESIGNFVNAALHIWGYFKDDASDKEKSSFLKSIEMYKQGQVSGRIVKNFLFKMTYKYPQYYLMNSYYFII